MKLIVLYGPPASGKYTVAKALAEKTGFKLFHNHLTVDLLKSVLPFGTPQFFQLSQKIRLEIFEEAAKQKISGIIFTFVYEKNTDDPFIQRTIDVVKSNGGEIVFVQIYCEKEELLKRVKEESRKQFQKVKSEEGLVGMLESGEMMATIPFVESSKIDNTNLSVDETIAKAMDLIK
jgi:dephospho-CoA kinase